MSYFRYIDPVEVEFHCWITNYPESYHPCDRTRFYSFVDAVLHYKKSFGKKWLDKDHFLKRCLEYKPSISSEVLEHYWAVFSTIRDYREFRKPCIAEKQHRFDDRPFHYYLVIVVDRELKYIKIDEQTYNKKYIGKRGFMRLLRESETNKNG